MLGAAFASTAAAATISIMPLGDSITAAANPGYRGYLYRELVNAGYSVDFVGTQSGTPTLPTGVTLDGDHEGHGGYSVGPGPSSLDPGAGGKGNLYVNINDWLSPTNTKTQNCDIILLLIGVNDYANIIQQNLDPTYDINNEFTQRLAGLLDKILSVRPHVCRQMLRRASTTNSPWCSISRRTSWRAAAISY